MLDCDARLSKWTLETKRFGRTFRFSWLAKNLVPVKHRLIHWTSVDDAATAIQAGLRPGFIRVRNKGELHFREVSSTSTSIRLTISYDVPPVLLPLSDVLNPTVDATLLKYMRNFQAIAEAEQSQTA